MEVSDFTNDFKDHMVCSCQVSDVEDVHLDSVGKLGCSIIGHHATWSRPGRPFGAIACIARHRLNGCVNPLVGNAIHSQQSLEFCWSGMCEVLVHPTEAVLDLRTDLESIREGDVLRGIWHNASWVVIWPV